MFEDGSAQVPSETEIRAVTGLSDPGIYIYPPWGMKRPPHKVSAALCCSQQHAYSQDTQTSKKHISG